MRRAYPHPENILDIFAIARVGLNLDLPGPAKAVEVVDVGAANRGLQRTEDVTDRDPQGLGALAIQTQVDLRRLGSIGRVNIGERRVLVGGNNEPVRHGREFFRCCTGECLQLQFEPGSVAEPGDRRHIEGNNIGSRDLPK